MRPISSSYDTTMAREEMPCVVVRYAADGHGGEPEQWDSPADGAECFRGTLAECRDWIAAHVPSNVSESDLHNLAWSGVDEDIEAYHDYPESHPQAGGCGGYSIRQQAGPSTR